MALPIMSDDILASHFPVVMFAREPFGLPTVAKSLLSQV